MKKRMFFLVVLVVSIVIFTIISNTTSAEIKKEIRISKEVHESLRDKATKVIINAKDKGELINLLEKEEIKIDYISKTRNFVSVEINKNDLDILKENSNINTISIEPQVELFLQDSLTVINATRNINMELNNTNMTGEGETICIIDSGVDYTHSDLGGCLGAGCKVLAGYAYFNPVNSTNPNNPMDDYGHGTHVSGIVAANGSIIGVSPNANIVIIKACGPTSSCSWSSIVDGVNWCVDNSTLHNITVISMSLGTSLLYNSYCDSSYTNMRDAINGAIAKNITVVAATGNNGNTASIASPACIENTTAVGSSNKADGMYTGSNRNNITDFLAPGQSINSTYLSGGYYVTSGTSMSAPHVAGAFALIKQYIRLHGENITKTETELALNSTATLIYDSGTGFYFPRIDVFTSLLYLRPYINNFNVTLISYPGKNMTINSQIYDYNLSKAWYILYDQNNIEINSILMTNLSSGMFVDFVSYYNTSNLSSGTYKVKFYSNNTNNKISFMKNVSFKISEARNITINITTSQDNRSNATIKIDYQNYIIENFDCNELTSKLVPSENYSLKLESLNNELIVTLNNINLTLNKTINITLQNITTSQVPTINGYLHNLIYVFNHNESLITTLCLNYTNISQQNVNNLKIYNCTWNSTAQNCSDDLTEITSFLQNNLLCSNLTSFSAFVLAEIPYCGDGYCDSNNGETCSSCSPDCGDCGGGTSENGGSGGGGGGITPTKINNVSESVSIPCIESWICGNWSECINGTQTRECIDENYCGTTENKPRSEGECEQEKENGVIPLTRAIIREIRENISWIGAVLIILFILMIIFKIKGFKIKKN